MEDLSQDALRLRHSHINERLPKSTQNGRLVVSLFYYLRYKLCFSRRLFVYLAVCLSATSHIDWIFTKIFISDVFLDEEVTIKFWKSSGSRSMTLWRSFTTVGRAEPYRATLGSLCFIVRLFSSDNFAWAGALAEVYDIWLLLYLHYAAATANATDAIAVSKQPCYIVSSSSSCLQWRNKRYGNILRRTK